MPDPQQVTQQQDEFAQFKVGASADDDFAKYKVSGKSTDNPESSIASRAWHWLTSPTIDSDKMGQKPDFSRAPVGPEFKGTASQPEHSKGLDEAAAGMSSPLSLATMLTPIAGPEASLGAKIASRVPLGLASGANVASGVNDVAGDHPFRGAAEIGLGLLGARGAVDGAGKPMIRAAGKGLTWASDAVNPDITGLISPRLPHLQRMAGKLGRVLQNVGTKQPVFPSGVQGPAMESGNFSPIEGEYVDSPPVKQLPGGPEKLPSQVISDPTPEAKPAPYRFGPGKIAPEDVNAPDPNVLGGRAGTRLDLTPKGALPDPARWKVPRTFDDIWDDKVKQDFARRDLESAGRSAFREERQQFEAGSSADAPKWQRAAQFKADQIMSDAQKQAQEVLNQAQKKVARPTMFTSTKTAAKTPLPKVQTTPPSDLENALRESLKRARK